MTVHDSNYNSKLIALRERDVTRLEAGSTLTDQDEHHLVRRSRGGKPYMRRKPFTYKQPTEAQLRNREKFGKVAAEYGKGKTGLITIEKDGVLKDIPRSAEPLMRLNGKRTKTTEPSGDTPPTPPGQ